MNNRILLLLSNLNSQFGNTLLTTQQQGRGELELESQRAVWYPLGVIRNPHNYVVL